MFKRSYWPGQVFGDVTDIEDDAGCRLYCYREDMVVNVPACDILVAGYPCKALSGLNSNPKAFNDPESTTGGPQQSIMRYCVTRKPQVLIFENVKQMVMKRKVEDGEAHWLLSVSGTCAALLRQLVSLPNGKRKLCCPV